MQSVGRYVGVVSIIRVGKLRAKGRGCKKLRESANTLTQQQPTCWCSLARLQCLSCKRMKNECIQKQISDDKYRRNAQGMRFTTRTTHTRTVCTSSKVKRTHLNMVEIRNRRHAIPNTYLVHCHASASMGEQRRIPHNTHHTGAAISECKL